jgi:carbamoyltransferase
MKVLGLSFGYHDSAAAIIDGGSIIWAAQEERFSRVKGDSSFPKGSIRAGLKQTNLTLSDFDLISYYEIPNLKRDRQITAAFSTDFLNKREAFKLIFKRKVLTSTTILELIESEFQSSRKFKGKIVASEHHVSHAASAFFPSPFRESAILTVDGVGEWATTCLGTGSNTSLYINKEMHYPHSIGLMYSAFTEFLGFKVNSGEYKVMGLAPYGTPKFVKDIKNLICRNPDGSYFVDATVFHDWVQGSFATPSLENLLKVKSRQPESDLLQVHADLAASLQEVLNETIVELATQALSNSGSKNLSMAGGVALNCVANSEIVRKIPVQDIFIQPAAGDSGAAIGCALHAYFEHTGDKRKILNPDSMKGSYLGTKFERKEIKLELDRLNAVYKHYDEEALIDFVSMALARGSVVGWFQGAMEFGPRALGNRSILADPRGEDVQFRLNIKTKFRESFRPFAPAVMVEHANKWFRDVIYSPYMLFTYPVLGAHFKEKIEKNTGDFKISFDKLKNIVSSLPGITHLDFSARVQTVDRKTNPKFYKLLNGFYELTGCPVLINTSFNVRGEPIVNSIEDAFNCFLRTDIDILAVDNYILLKNNQDVKHQEIIFALD